MTKTVECLGRDKFFPLKKFGHPIQRGIMPIIAKVGDQFFPIGTGFMVQADGLMMTATHVVSKAAKRRFLRQNTVAEYDMQVELYALYITDEKYDRNDKHKLGGLCPITRAWHRQELDIALCRVTRPMVNGKPIIKFRLGRLSPGLPKPGEKIIGFGYYEMKGNLTDKVLDGSRLAYYAQQTAFTTGQIVEIHPKRRDSSFLRWPCFRTEARFNPGMSGGPIYNESGSICGVICAGDSGGHGDPPQYTSYGALLWPALGIQIELRLRSDDPAEKLLLYDLVKKGLVATDDTIRDIRVVTHNSSGQRTVELSSTHT